jgi:hypothetical protein
MVWVVYEVVRGLFGALLVSVLAVVFVDLDPLIFHTYRLQAWRGVNDHESASPPWPLGDSLDSWDSLDGSRAKLKKVRWAIWAIWAILKSIYSLGYRSYPR